MEVVSIIGLTGSVLGIVDVVAKSISMLRRLQLRWQAADWTVNSLLGQLDTLKLALSQISDWLSMDLAADPQHALLADGLCTSLDCCRTLTSFLASHISQLELGEADVLTFESRVKIVLNDSRFKECMTQLSNQSSALTLLLTALNWYVPQKECDYRIIAT